MAEVDLPPGTPPASPLAYHQLHRAGRRGWWVPVVGVLVLLVIMLVAVPIGLVVPFVVGFLLTGQDVPAALEEMLDLGDPTPAGLAYLNLSLAAAIPVTWFLARVLHGVRPRWLSSVGPRLRWPWLFTCFGLSLVALVLTVVASALLPAQGDAPLGGGLNEWTTTVRDFALVVVLLTPLQAAGEEYAFRGYLTQAFGGLFRQRWVAVLGPAVLFALAHGAQDAPIFFDRFAFGVVSGVLVIATGGLEAGIAMHVLNNWLAFGLALAFGDMGSTLNPTGGTWWSIPVTLVQSLSYLALALWAARRLGVRTAVAGDEVRTRLVGQNPRV